MSRYRSITHMFVGTLAGVFVALVVTTVGFALVINNQAWPVGGHLVATSRILFILALMPFWALAAVASSVVDRCLTRDGAPSLTLVPSHLVVALMISFQVWMLVNWNS